MKKTIYCIKCGKPSKFEQGHYHGLYKKKFTARFCSESCEYYVNNNHLGNFDCCNNGCYGWMEKEKVKR